MVGESFIWSAALNISPSRNAEKGTEPALSRMSHVIPQISHDNAHYQPQCHVIQLWSHVIRVQCHVIGVITFYAGASAFASLRLRGGSDRAQYGPEIRAPQYQVSVLPCAYPALKTVH
eukprot:1886518-Rhodomonas_salina.1